MVRGSHVKISIPTNLIIHLSSSSPLHTYTLLLLFSLVQEEDVHKAQLIELNVDLIDRATLVIRSAIANAMDWGDIELLVKDAQGRGDPVATAIHGLKLKSNEITLILR